MLIDLSKAQHKEHFLQNAALLGPIGQIHSFTLQLQLESTLV